MTKAEKTELRKKMQCMVDEANSLRNEASEKMYNIPKGYKLYAVGRTAKFRHDAQIYLTIAVVYMVAFAWSMSGSSAIHHVVQCACSCVLGCGAVMISKVMHCLCHPEAYTRRFYVEYRCYDELADEIGRLRAGIAEYNRQYAEQEEYILKFKQYTWPIIDEQLGVGSLEIVLKAYSFHATLRFRMGEETFSLRLDFNETGYNQMDTLVKRFEQGLTESSRSLSEIFHGCCG